MCVGGSHRIRWTRRRRGTWEKRKGEWEGGRQTGTSAEVHRRGEAGGGAARAIRCMGGTGDPQAGRHSRPLADDMGAEISGILDDGRRVLGGWWLGIGGGTL